MIFREKSTINVALLWRFYQPILEGTLKFDVTNQEDVHTGISTSEKKVGAVDILVNNSGIIKRIPILEIPIEDFKQVIDVNLVAPLLVTKRIVPGMMERKSGEIISLCSMMSVYGRDSVSAYASAKRDLKLLTANRCCEWAK